MTYPEHVSALRADCNFYTGRNAGSPADARHNARLEAAARRIEGRACVRGFVTRAEGRVLPKLRRMLRR